MTRCDGVNKNVTNGNAGCANKGGCQEYYKCNFGIDHDVANGHIMLSSMPIAGASVTMPAAVAAASIAATTVSLSCNTNSQIFDALI